MTRIMKTVLVALCGMIAAAGLFGAGTAEAKMRETPRIGVMGEEVWTVGNNGACRGSIHAGLQNDPRRPGIAQVTLRSRGFTSDNCRAVIKFVFHNTVAPFNHERFISVRGTRKAGTVLARKQYWIGSGVDLVSITSNTPASKGVSYYIAIP